MPLLVNINPSLWIAGYPPDAIYTQAYSFSFTAPEGTTPLEWQFLSGDLPEGLTYDAGTSTLSGTPTEAGTFSFELFVRDARGLTGRRVIPLRVLVNMDILGAPPAGTTGVPYSFTPTVSGGVAPYTWAIHQGELPPGLSLNVATGEISGTATEGSTSVLQIQVTDANGYSAFREIVIVIEVGTYLLYAAAPRDALHVFEATGTSLSAPSTTVSAGDTRRVFRRGDFLYGGFPDFFRIYDLAIPLAPSPVFSTGNPGAGSFAFDDSSDVLFCGWFHLTVYDVSNPTAPTLIASDNSVDRGLRSIILDGTTLYLYSDFGDDLYIYDVSTPSAPTRISTTHIVLTSTDAEVMVKSGNYMFFHNGDQSFSGTVQLLVFDVADPNNVTQVGACTGIDGGGFSSGILLDGNVVYVGAKKEGQPDSTHLLIYDITTATAPALKAALQLNPSSIADEFHFARSPDALFMSAFQDFDNSSSIYGIDVSDPDNPVLQTTIELTGDDNGVAGITF